MNNLDNKEKFAEDVSKHFTALLRRLEESINKDKILVSMDAIGLEAIRLDIKGWDQMTIAKLRHKIQQAKLKEKQALGIFKSEQNK